MSLLSENGFLVECQGGKPNGPESGNPFQSPKRKKRDLQPGIHREFAERRKGLKRLSRGGSRVEIKMRGGKLCKARGQKKKVLFWRSGGKRGKPKKKTRMPSGRRRRIRRGAERTYGRKKKVNRNAVTLETSERKNGGEKLQLNVKKRCQKQPMVLIGGFPPPRSGRERGDIRPRAWQNNRKG